MVLEGDLLAFSQTPSFSPASQLFGDGLVMERVTDFERPFDDDRDNSYHLIARIYERGSDPRVLVAEASFQVDITNETNRTWAQNGYRFLLAPLTTEEFDGGERAQLPDFRRMETQDSPVNLGDIDGDSGSEIVIPLRGGLEPPEEGVRVAATLFTHSWLNAQDGAISDFSNDEPGSLITFVVPGRRSTSRSFVVSLPDLDGDGANELGIVREHPELNSDSLPLIDINRDTGIHIISSRTIRGLLNSGTTQYVLAPDGGEPGESVFLIFDTAIHGVESNATSILADAVGLEPFDEDANAFVFSLSGAFSDIFAVIPAEVLSDSLRTGGRRLINERSTESFFVDLNEAASGLSYLRGSTNPIGDGLVRPIGDIDGDGHTDLGFSHLIDTNELEPVPALFLIDGSVIATMDGTETNLEALVESGGARILQGADIRDRFGDYFVGVGDVDADGFDDFIVASTGDVTPLVDGQSVFRPLPLQVFYGGANVFDAPPSNNANDFELRGALTTINGVTEPPIDGVSCESVVTDLINVGADLDGDGLGDVIALQAPRCGQITSTGFIVGTDRLSARADIDLSEIERNSAAYSTRNDLEMLTGLGRLHPSEGPTIMASRRFFEEMALIDLERIQSSLDGSGFLPPIPVEQQPDSID